MADQFGSESVVGEVQDLLLDTQDVADFLGELARFASGTLSASGGEVFCGITLLRHHGMSTVASSSEKARLLDELQYRFDDGPCLTASREQTLVYIPDLELNQAYPKYKTVAVQAGVRSILAIPFELPSDAAKAALNLYAERAFAFTPSTIEAARSFVAQPSKGLRLAILLTQHSQTAENLRSALSSRTVIDTAVGVIIAQNRCSQEEAIRIIKAASANRNIKLRDLATRIVESAGGGQIRTHFT